MGTIVRGTKTGTGTTAFGPSTVAKSSEVNTDFNTIYSEFNGNIDNDNIKASAAIVGTKLDLTAVTQLQLTTSTLITGIFDEDTMASNSATAVPTQQSVKAYVDTQVAAVKPIVLTTDVSGTLPLANGGTNATTAQLAINSLTAVAAATNEHVLTKDTATGNAIFKEMVSKSQIFTSTGTFTAPAGITKVYVTMIGGGGGGGSGDSPTRGGGGGAAGQLLVNYPVTVVAGSSYTVTIGALGAGGIPGSDGSDGGSTSFDTTTVLGGNKGLAAQTGGAARVINGTANSGGAAAGGLFGITTGAGGNGYASGAGGGGGGGSPFGPGGAGGTGSAVGAAAGANTGAGGGGGGTNGHAGGNGGSGICIVMY